LIFLRIIYLLTFCFGILSQSHAQVFSIRDSLSGKANQIQIGSLPEIADTLNIQTSGIPNNLDAIRNSAMAAGAVTASDVSAPTGVDSRVKVADDGLDEQVDFSAVDSQRIDIVNQVVYLYGGAKVIYASRTLTADYIVFDMKNNIATAEGVLDSVSGAVTGLPYFEDGEQKFESERLKYNFKKGKGIIYAARTQQSDMYILGDRTKYISQEKKDTLIGDIIYSSNALITTCNHPEPHFGIRAKKIKVVPDKVAVVGPSNLEIAGVATPIVLPFGFFPLSQNKQTGMVRGEFERSGSLGLGFRGWGWYFPISDYLDLTVRGDIYSRGTFRLYGDMNYYKRYKYRGALNLTVTSNKTEQGLDFFRSKSIGLNWRHNQDAKANPAQSFGGSVNLQTNNNQAATYNDADSRLENTVRSNINYNNRFPDKNYTFSAGLSHSQNTRSRRVTIDFPNADFKVQQFFPFKRKIPKAKPSWYEKISVRYDANLKGRIVATDTTLFTQETLDDLQVGMRQRASANASFNLFKFIQVGPNANFTEVWNIKSLEKRLNPDLTIEVDSIQLNPGEPKIAVLDTTAYGTVEEELVYGFKPYRLFTTGVSASTKLFGTLKFKKGWLRGIRHQVSPSVSFNYTPDYTSGFLDYFREVDTDIRSDFNNPEEYNIFGESIYERPSAVGEQRNLSFRLGNLVEAKYYSKKDSTSKKFKLINTLNVSGTYNMAKDTQQWSVIRFSGNTSFFDRLTTLTFGWQLDPYALDENGRRSNNFNRNENGKLLRFVDANVGLTTRMPLKKLREIITGKKTPARTSNRNGSSSNGPPPGVGGDSAFGDGSPGNRTRNTQSIQQPASLWEWFETFTLSHEFRARVQRVDGRDTLVVQTHGIRTSGNIQLTEKWRLNFGNIAYDFKNKAFSYPSLGFTRDLHCWELNMQWYPESGVYSFSLRVKPGSLGFINVPWGQNRFDGSRQFR